MDYKQIPGAYEDVARDLKSKYYLTYISNQQKADNSYHRIELQYLQPAGAVNFRRGYFFRPDQIQIPYRRP